MPLLPASTVALAKSREALALYETAMNPKVRELGKRHWGEGIPEGATPAYLHQFKQCVGHSMRDFVTEERELDAFTIGAIVMRHPRVFLPDTIKQDDLACELHR